ncbi:uncharacterized protein LOC109833563 isoform X1 [Asparagus officinalis]|nr:uncharacterized protein LOC109833563 isoform X1 [Asparagus officinalis]
MRPSIPQQHQFVVPRQQIGNGGAPRTAAPSKVGPFAAIPSVPENNSNDRENSSEDSIVVIHDRKVRLSEGTSGSLYALCRSWVRNGPPQVSQSTFGDSLRILPKPLPAALVNMQANTSEDSNGNDKSDKDEDLGPIEQLSAQDLLKGHIKHAKKVRARLNKERHLRIERYKQRLSLLLPTQIELIGRNEATPGR